MKLLVFLGAAAAMVVVALLLGACQSTANQGTLNMQVIQTERCAICHEDVGEVNHQEIYDKYTDQSDLTLTIDSVTNDGVMTVSITKDGAPLIDEDGLPSLNQKRFSTVLYDSTTQTFDKSVSFSNPVSLGDGRYTLTASSMDYDLNTSNGEAYGYIADTPLDIKTTGHVIMYDNVASAGLAFGNVSTYESPANVAGCEKCHGTPYMKHGYRNPIVDGLPDFASCKTCHYDTRSGHDQSWQIMVNDPARYAEIHNGDSLTDEETTKYAYTANLMNDVHMSHSMEFPYPQSMATCATCHEGKLDKILTAENFNLTTCKSCHPVNEPAGGTDPDRAPALSTVIPHPLDQGTCSDCHREGGYAPAFNQIHTGYNPVIYTPTGTKYSDVITVTVDSASFKSNKLTFSFSAHESQDLGLDVSTIEPTVMVGLYGYDTKDFIVGPHERLTDDNGDGTIDSKDQRALEYTVGSDHPRYKTVSSGGGSWEVTADLSKWADMIKNGTVKRVEIAVRPVLLNNDGVQIALNAPSRTFDLNANGFDDSFYSDIVDVQNGCNTCHDALATTFHSPDRGGNIVVCRMCHIVKNGASHLELQSRSIDSYVHAIHSFQAFDIGDIDFTDPVAATEYDEHIGSSYPNFTLFNCESCHLEGTFNVPDQSYALPGILSGSDEVTTMDRNIKDIPSYVTGPASRACGGCHRANFIKADDAAGLEAFLQHTNGGGYLIPNQDGTLDSVIKSVMAVFAK